MLARSRVWSIFIRLHSAELRGLRQIQVPDLRGRAKCAIVWFRVTSSDSIMPVLAQTPARMYDELIDAATS